MRFIVVFMLIATLEGSLALSEGEKTAVSDLLKEWSFLRSVSPAWTSNSSEACTVPFQGIICSDGPDQHIISLVIDAGEQSGALPETIGGLFELQTLKLVINVLKGRLPSSVGSLTKLRNLVVDMRSNWNFCLPATLSNLENLTRLEFLIPGYLGDFPQAISKLRKLKHLTLGRSRSSEQLFYGSIPASLCDLDQLMSVELNSVALSGFEICAGKLPHLEVLSFSWAPQMILPLRTLLVGRLKLKQLTLSQTHVYGPLELEGQVMLEQLTLSVNDISGTLPDSLTDNPNLVRIIVENCKVGGTLPTSIGKLSLLETMSISGTYLSGTIPPEIGLCKHLTYIHLSYTRLTGTIPSEIGHLSNLEDLSFSHSSIIGTIPNSFNQLVSLTLITLDGCQLSGTIPSGLLSLPNLILISATQNRLTGTIPDESSSACNFLVLNSNFLEGSVPSAALRSCMVVSLSQNRLSGQITHLVVHPELSYLDLSGNEFTGSLPHISNAQGLNLDLSSNRFSGTIPDHYRTTNLRSIDLTDNQLEGDISPILNEYVSKAELGYNRFNGSIPNSIVTSHIWHLSISNNFLTGTLPRLPSGLTRLEASGNLFDGTLDNIFKAVSPNQSLQYLDLSHNLLEGPPPAMSSFDSFTFISLAISIPFLVVYMFGVPFGFVVMSWKLRHKISSPFVRLYFGSLFENYQIRLFWWELVNTLRKLIVALLLRGLSPGDSFQHLFITLILGSIGVINAILKPWRRGIDNFLDGIGSALLILSMDSNLLGSLNHSSQTGIIILVLDSVYIAFCVLVIGWRTIRSETSYEKEWKLKYGSESRDDSTKPALEDYGPPVLSNDGALNILGSE